MAKTRQAIGLDIGAQSVKMVCLELKGDSVAIVDYKIKEYLKQEERSKTINEMLKDVSKDIPVIASVEGSHVFIRVFKLPGVAKSKLARIVAYEAQQQVPFPIDEVVWSYQCLRRVSPEETDVVLTAIRASVIRDLLASLEIDVADVVPPVIGLNNLLSWTGYEDIRDPSDQAVMVLDLGAKTTDVIIVEKQNLWFRTIPIGGEVITQVIASEYGISYANAELLKKEKGEIVLEEEAEPNSDRRRMSTSIIRALTRLTSEISRSVEVYSSSFNSLGPRNIFITGGGAGLKNIGRFFGKKFRTDVSLLNIEKRFSVKEGFPQDVGRFGTALGLALHGIGFCKIRLSLLPKEILNKYKWLNRQPYVIAASGLLIFLGLCFSGYNLQMTRIFRTNISRLENDLKAVDSNKRKIMDIQEELDTVRDRMDMIDMVRSSRDFWSDMLLELEGLLPDNTWLVDIEPLGQSKEEIGLILRGKTMGTYEDVMRLKDALNNSTYFVKDSPEVVSANPPVDGVRDFVIETKARIR